MLTSILHDGITQRSHFGTITIHQQRCCGAAEPRRLGKYHEGLIFADWALCEDAQSFVFGVDEFEFVRDGESLLGVLTAEGSGEGVHGVYSIAAVAVVHGVGDVLVMCW